MSPSAERLTVNPTAHTSARAHTIDDASDPDLQRARSRSRSRSPHVIDATAVTGSSPRGGIASDSTRTRRTPIRTDSHALKPAIIDTDHLSPNTALGMGRAYWRHLSRSPSPLGLIPIHREWRQFIHKHEIPRKALHVSIGFLVLVLYTRGYHVVDAAPTLFKLFVPISLTDVIRMRYPPLNRFYIRVLGALMRESEAHDRYNGVISYMAGALFVAIACPADVAIMSIVCLSWCDTAASTFGRLYGRYTPRIRKGKSLAGSIAAFLVGVATALLFWGYLARSVPSYYNEAPHAFAFQGHLTLPAVVTHSLGLSVSQATIHGTMALVAVSVWSGLVVSMSEAVDILGLDDNLTIPVLCGVALSTSLKACT